MTKAFDYALQFADELGFKVFPVKPLDKLPLTDRGFKDASSEATQLLEWNRKWPTANWAVATGLKSGILIIDIDGQQGSEWWDDQWFEPGVEVITPRGGRHIYYAYTDESVDISIGQKAFHSQIDWRGNGGYALLPGSATSSSVNSTNGDGEYVGTLGRFPALPKSVIDIIPERKVIERDTEDLDVEGKPNEESEGGKRVIKGALDRLDALPKPWRPGAGYHETQFNVACHLWRIARSKHYALREEQAYRLFMQHAPVNPEAKEDLQTKRWNSAREATEGEAAEHPGDVPVRLPAADLLDKFPGDKIDRLFWESRNIRDVKDLIRELRHAGADKQEAYSVSYESAAMKGMRERNPTGSGSSWAQVVAEYANIANHDEPEESSEPEDEQAGDDIPATTPPSKLPAVTKMKTLLTDEERESVKDHPNFIDRYAAISKDLFSEPNMPLVYLNAWLALSAGVGDKGRIYEDGKATPLSLWGLLVAESAAGKGDAKNIYRDCTGRMRRGGFGEVNIGSDVSAEGINRALAERDGSVSVLMRDEAASLLRGLKNPRDHYYKLRDLVLDLYDGKGTRSTRVDSDLEKIGQDFDSTFNMWLQTTWDGATTALDAEDINTGFIGRLLFAIGDPPKITRESLKMTPASEFQVSIGGVNPMIVSLSDGVKTRFSPADSNKLMTWDDEVAERHVDAREALYNYVRNHEMRDKLRGIMLRLGQNLMKAACLIALSEGRTEVVMTDLLIALRSGEYWFRDCMKMVDGIGQTEPRKRINALVSFVAIAPRTRAAILKSAAFKNLTSRDILDTIDRAESEGLIIKPKGTEKWQIQ